MVSFPFKETIPLCRNHPVPPTPAHLFQSTWQHSEILSCAGTAFRMDSRTIRRCTPSFPARTSDCSDALFVFAPDLLEQFTLALQSDRPLLQAGCTSSKRSYPVLFHWWAKYRGQSGPKPVAKLRLWSTKFMISISATPCIIGGEGKKERFSRR